MLHFWGSFGAYWHHLTHYTGRQLSDVMWTHYYMVIIGVMLCDVDLQLSITLPHGHLMSDIQITALQYV